MKFCVKGQSAVEYLVIVAIALMVLIPGSYLFLSYSKGTTSQVASNQLNVAGSMLISEAEKMYVLGKNSWVTVEFSLPGNFMEGTIVDGQEMYFKFGSDAGESYALFFPVGYNISNSNTSNCEGNCPLGFTPGVNRVKIESQGSYVSIVRVQ